jgi:hypothetical protein
MMTSKGPFVMKTRISKYGDNARDVIQMRNFTVARHIGNMKDDT